VSYTASSCQLFVGLLLLLIQDFSRKFRDAEKKASEGAIQDEYGSLDQIKQTK